MLHLMPQCYNATMLYYKNTTLKELAKPLKTNAGFLIFTFFFFKKFSLIFVSLYKELLEPTFSACLIVLHNLCEAFGCSVVTDFISTMFEYTKVFGSYVIIFDCFSDFVFLFLTND